jgi:hypothetical protein
LKSYVSCHEHEVAHLLACQLLMNLVLKDFAARLQAKDLDLVRDFESTTTCKEHIFVEHLNCVDREVKHVAHSLLMLTSLTFSLLRNKKNLPDSRERLRF